MQNQIIDKINILQDYLEQWLFKDSVEYQPDEVAKIMQAEQKQTRINFLSHLKEFQQKNMSLAHDGDKKFVAFWGYPGAGKSFLLDKLIQRYQKENPVIKFNLIDKDQHRGIFPNLFSYLKGHEDECQKFGEPAMNFVRQILELSLKGGQTSIIGMGAKGAGIDFCHNANMALEYGYKPEAVYMSINPDIAYLSNVYRNCTLYDKMIHQHQELYPTLVSRPYFDDLHTDLNSMILQIDAFQKQKLDDVRLLVINRANETVYDSRTDQEQNVLGKIHYEENRPLTSEELILVHKQISQITTNIKYRCENNVFYPSQKETEALRIALTNTKHLLRRDKDKPRLVGMSPIFGETPLDFIQKKSSHAM